MRKRRLAFLMALVMTFTSVDSSALLVSAADASAAEEISVENAEAVPAEEAAPQAEAVPEQAAVESAEEAAPEQAAGIAPEQAAESAEEAAPEQAAEEAAPEQAAEGAEEAAPEQAAEGAEETAPEQTAEEMLSEEQAAEPAEEAEPEGAEEELIIGEEGTVDSSAVEMEAYTVDAQSVSDEHTIVGMSVVQKGQTAFIAGLEVYSPSGAQIKVTYKDGSDATVEFNELTTAGHSSEVDDAYGNTIHTYAESVADNPSVSVNSTFLRGDYKAIFSCWGVRAEYQISTVDLVESDSYKGILQEGTTSGVSSPWKQYAYYSFTPSQTGAWVIDGADGMTVYEKEEDNYQDVSSLGGNKYMLSAEKNYCIAFYSGSATGSDTRRISIKNIPILTSVSISGQPVSRCIVGDSKTVLEGAKVTFFYDNGTKKTVQADYSWAEDSYGNVVHIRFVDESGEYIYNVAELSVGTYTAQAYSEDIVQYEEYVLYEYDFTVNDLKRAETPLSLGENTEIEGGESYDVYYEFRPERSGRYAFAGFENTKILKGTDTGYEEISWRDSNYRRYDYDLEADETYYVGVCGESEDAVLKVQYIPVLTSMSMKQSGQTTFIAGLEYYQVDGAIITLTYDDGSSAAVEFAEGYSWAEDNYGNSIYVDVYAQDDTDRISPYSVGNYLPVGEYVAEFTCGEKSTGYAIEAVNLTASDRYKGELTEGKDITVSSPQSRVYWYTFTPSKDGTWYFGGVYNMDIYKRAEEDYLYVYSVSGSKYRLSVGTEYYIAFYTYEGCGESEERTISIAYQPTLTSVEVSGQPTSWRVGDDGGVLAGATVTFGYDNEESQIIQAEDYDATDSYGNTVNIRFVKADNEYTWNVSGLQPGDYTAQVYASGTVWQEYLFTVEDLELAGSLAEGENAGLAGGDEYTYYSFRPGRSGGYAFNGFQYLKVLKVTDTGYETIYSRSEDSYSRQYIYELESEITYYVGVRGNSDSSVLNIRYLPKILSAEAHPARTEFIANFWQTVYYDGLSVTLNYEEGIPAETVTYNNGSMQDSYGNTFRLSMYDQNDEYVSEWSEQPSGEYTIRIVDIKNWETLCSYTVSMKPIDEFEWETVSLGSQRVDVSRNGETTFYRFKAEKGRYFFKCDSDVGISLYTLAGENLEFEDSGWRTLSSLLNAEEYYLRVYSYEDTPVTTNLTIEAVPEVTGIETLGVSESLQYIEKFEEINPSEFRVRIVYSDGKTYDTSVYGYDSYDNWVRASIYRSGAVEEGEVEADVPGDYVLRITCGEAYTDIPFKVVSLENACQGTITLGEPAKLSMNQGKALYAFQAENAGKYELEFNLPVDNIQALSKAGNRAQVSSTSRYGSVLLAAEPDTYYIYLKAPEGYQTLEAELTAKSNIEKIVLNALKKEYIAGLEDFSGQDVKATVTYSDGTVSTAKEYADLQGNTLRYRVEKDGDEYHSGDALPIGTYSVVPYLSFGSGSAIETEKIAVEPVTVQSVRVDAGSLPVIRQDEPQIISYGYRTTMYSFTAAEAGKYEVQYNGIANCYFYYDEENGLREAGERISLQKDQTCVLVCTTNIATEICAKKVGEAENPEKPIVLKPDQKATVTVSKDHSRAEFTFTPEEDGRYGFSGEGDDVIAQVELYHNGGYLAEAEGEGEFYLAYDLKAGETYTYYMDTNVWWAASGQTFSFSILLSKAVEKEITEVEILGDEKDYTIFQDASDVFKIQVTYEDGLQEQMSLYTYRDSYGNRFESNAEQRVDGALIWVLYRKESAGDWNEETRTVKRRGVSDFEEIAAGGSESISADLTPNKEYNRYYSFVPQESGEYAFSLGAGTEKYGSWANVIQVDGRGNYEYLDTDYSTSSGENVCSVWLEAGKQYVIRVSAQVYGEEDETIAFSTTLGNRKLKRLTGLSVVKQPVNPTVVSGTFVAEANGLQVKATYEDGSEELLEMGDKDSDGRYLRWEGAWINNETYRMYIFLGQFRTHTDLTAVSADNLKDLEENKENPLTPGSRNDFRFAPENTGAYVFGFTSANGGRTYVICEEDETSLGNGIYGYYYLEAGKHYIVSAREFTEACSLIVTYSECVWTVTERKEPTCEEAGLIKETCRLHGDTRETILPALGHVWGEWQVTTSATCAKAGEKVRTCSRCAETEKETISATGKHTYQWITDKKATCGAAGSRHEECTVCHAKKKAVAISATGKHTYQWITDKKATCGTAGSKHEECKICHTKKKAVAIKATGSHKYGAWKTVKAATALAAGSKKRTCSVCKKAETATIAKLKRYVNLTANSLTLKVKQSTTKFKVTGMAKGDYLKSVVSSNTKVLRVSGVNKNGSVKLTALNKTGTVNLTFTLASGAKKTIKAKVQKGAVKTTSINGVKKTATVTQGKTLKLTPSLLPVTSVEKITYTSSNKKVATVSSKGVVKGVKAGTAKITVKAGSKKFICTVKVQGIKTTSLKNVPKTYSLKVKKTYTLKPTRVPAASKDTISYSSSNKSIATVDSKGKITAKKKGTAVITVKCGSAVATCKVTVK